MADDLHAPEGSFLQRWSRRKHAASREVAPAPSAPASVAPLAAISEPVPADVASPGGGATSAEPDKELPSVESLSFESDFTAFLKPGVDGATRQQALKKLFSDARFNVMDGLDVYIDDYSKFVPMSPEIVEQLVHARYLFDPPKTRVNALGHGEDVINDETPVEPDQALQAGDDALIPDTVQAQAATAAGACAPDATEVETIPPLSVASATDERR